MQIEKEWTFDEIITLRDVLYDRHIANKIVVCFI